MESSKEHLSKIEIFCKIMNVFTSFLNEKKKNLPDPKLLNSSVSAILDKMFWLMFGYKQTTL